MTPWYDDVIAINDFQEVKELNENKPNQVRAKLIQGPKEPY